MIVTKSVIEGFLSVQKLPGVPDEEQFRAMAKQIAIQTDQNLQQCLPRELTTRVLGNGDIQVTPIGRTWVAYGLTWDSFVAADLNNPGVQIKHLGKRFLIGSINMLGGVCNDCAEFNGTETIDAYRIIATENELNG